MKGVFVIGTDTGVGKTVVCAGLLKLIQGSRPVSYWKPVQTGTIAGDDTAEVKALTGLDAPFFMDPVHRFPEPLAPYLAAKKWGKTIDDKEISKRIEKQKAESHFVIIEGAGGLLVPFNEGVLQSDVIKSSGFPILLVGEDRVGTINQCLLTVRAARAMEIPVMGVILTKCRGTMGNAECIRKFGNVEVVVELLPREDKRSIVAEVGGNDRLRTLFQVPLLPA